MTVRNRKNYCKMKNIYLCLIITGLFIWPVFCLGNVVINEIMIGQTESTKNEFIELYNPTENNIDLTKYRLKKKTSSGKESNLISSSKFTGIIKRGGVYIISLLRNSNNVMMTQTVLASEMTYTPPLIIKNDGPLILIQGIFKFLYL